MTCIFCEIAAGRIPSTFLYQDEDVLAFPDINPKAPHHILVIPKQHIATLNDFSADQTNLIGHLVQVATRIAKQLGIAESGYRLVINCNADGGQEVFHVHVHLLGGKPLPL